jgi:hypothetical protein
MKYIKVYESYSETLPSEDEVYKVVDDYLEKVNHGVKNIDTKYGRYFETARNRTNFKAAYFELSELTDKKPDDVYTGIFLSLKNKGYNIDAYSPIVTDSEKKALDMFSRINMEPSPYTLGEYGRGITIKCQSGKTLCFYFLPDNSEGWSNNFGVLRFGVDCESIYWTEVDEKTESVWVVFWNGQKIAHGNFKLSGEYEYDFDNDGDVYDFENCSCEAASDGRKYSGTAKRVVDENSQIEEMTVYKN